MTHAVAAAAGSKAPAPCLVCGSSDTRLRYAALRYRKRPGVKAWDMHQCRECGLLFVWPTPSHGDIAAVYADPEYRAEDLQDHTTIPGVLEDRVLDTLEQVGIRPNGRLLDVGCGAGHFLHRARGRGWQVLGQEIAVHSAAFARETYGLTILAESLDILASSLPPAQFDLITLIGVIEHVPDPVTFLRQLRVLLKPTGTLFILTDNARSWLHFLLRRDFPFIMPPEHLQLFTPRSIDALLYAGGFRRTALRTHETIFADAAVRGVSMLLGRGRAASPSLNRFGQIGVWLLMPIQRILWRMRLGAQLYVTAGATDLPIPGREHFAC